MLNQPQPQAMCVYNYNVSMSLELEEKSHQQQPSISTWPRRSLSAGVPGNYLCYFSGVSSSLDRRKEPTISMCLREILSRSKTVQQDLDSALRKTSGFNNF